MLRRLLTVGLPALVLLAALGGGAWWLFVREDNELADAAPEIPDDLRSSSPGATSTAAGSDAPGVTTFNVMADRSEAAYFAGEKLARLSVPSTAKGATKEITGELHLDGDGLAPGRESKFTVQLRNLKSDEPMRDRRVHDALQTSRFPTATFVATSVSGPLDALNPETDTDLQLTGMLELRGVQREVTWDVKAKRDGNVLTAVAQVNFRYADFGIPVPNIGGFVTVEEDVTLQVLLTAQASG